MKKLIFIAVALLLVISLAACGSSNGKFFGASERLDFNEKSSFESDIGKYDGDTEKASDTEAKDSSDRKIVYNAYLALETLEYDKTLEEIKQLILSCEGYTASSSYENSSSYNNRYCHISARIPVKYYDEFIKKVSAAGNLVNLRESTDDVTAQYYDYDARLKSLYTQEERLLEMLSQTNDVYTLIELEKRLSEVRYEIENYESYFNYLKNSIDYSTVNINITEVITYSVSEDNFFTQILNALKDGCEGLVFVLGELLLLIIAALPALIVIALIVIVIVLLVKRSSKKRAAKLSAPNQNNTNN